LFIIGRYVVDFLLSKYEKVVNIITMTTK